MNFLLDTSAWIDYLNQRHPTVARRILGADPADLPLSSVVLAELRYGAEKSRNPQRNHERLDILARELPRLDFDEGAAASFGILRSAPESRGKPIGPYDMLIAAQALSRRLVLVTDNVREFERVPGLRIENWRNG